MLVSKHGLFDLWMAILLQLLMVCDAVRKLCVFLFCNFCHLFVTNGALYAFVAMITHIHTCTHTCIHELMHKYTRTSQHLVH